MSPPPLCFSRDARACREENTDKGVDPQVFVVTTLSEAALRSAVNALLGVAPPAPPAPPPRTRMSPGEFGRSLPGGEKWEEEPWNKPR